MKIAKIYTFDVANGEGIRVSLFVSGCDFHCKGCFNEELQDYAYGTEYTNAIKYQILDILKHPDYKGLSLLGGDPLRQDKFGLAQLIELCDAVHEVGKDVWMWSGYTYEEISNLDESGSEATENRLRKELVQQADYFIEGRFIEDKKDLSLPWRGSSNQNIIRKPSQLAISCNN